MRYVLECLLVFNPFLKVVPQPGIKKTALKLVLSLHFGHHADTILAERKLAYMTIYCFKWAHVQWRSHKFGLGCISTFLLKVLLI